MSDVEPFDLVDVMEATHREFRSGSTRWVPIPEYTDDDYWWDHYWTSAAVDLDAPSVQLQRGKPPADDLVWVMGRLAFVTAVLEALLDKVERDKLERRRQAEQNRRAAREEFRRATEIGNFTMAVDPEGVLVLEGSCPNCFTAHNFRPQHFLDAGLLEPNDQNLDYLVSCRPAIVCPDCRSRPVLNLDAARDVVWLFFREWRWSWLAQPHPRAQRGHAPAVQGE